MAATPGQRFIDRCQHDTGLHQILHGPDREAGAKARGSASTLPASAHGAEQALTHLSGRIEHMLFRQRLCTNPLNREE